MVELLFDGPQFIRRAKYVYERLKMPLVVMLGKAADVGEFNANSAMFHYFLGYEFPETILVVDEKPLAIASAKKALMLEGIEGLRLAVKNKDDSNLEEILAGLQGKYGVVDESNLRGDFTRKVLARIQHADVTREVFNMLLVKEATELEYAKKAGIVANYLLQKGIDMIRDMRYSKEDLEDAMGDTIRGIDSSLVTFSFDPEHSQNHLRVGVRYKGYCAEVARQFLADLTMEYDIQRYMLSIVRPGCNSAAVLAQVASFCLEKSYSASVKMYSIGLLDNERSFEDSFELGKNMLFCLNISDEFCNTFILDAVPVFVTKKDAKEDYSESKMRFRNKGNDMTLAAMIKEHQKELLDNLVEERMAFYRANVDKKAVDTKDEKSIIMYEKESAVPRANTVFLDWDYNCVIIPVCSYSVPFHISTIKNVSIAADGAKLRINFKEARRLLSEKVGDSGEVEAVSTSDAIHDSNLKTITVTVPNAEMLLVQINDMRKEYNRPKPFIAQQGTLKERPKKFVLAQLYVKTDSKTNAKKTVGGLELHENGFKYNDITILFSSIRNIFYQPGDFETRALIHFNLKQPIAVAGKATNNLQFFRKLGFAYHDTGKREDERIDYIQHQEEETENAHINSEFAFFVERIEAETVLKVQFPEKGFLGVHSKETVHVSATSECLVSLSEQPFFILNLDEVEIVNFERVTFVTKTFDCAFVFKDKTKPATMINSIEITRLGYMKELMDNHNIVFMETKVNLNWPNLMATIMQDPLSFYESGGWAELLREDEEEESEVSSSDSSSEVSSLGSTTSSDDMSESFDESESTDDSAIESDDEDEDDDDSDSEDRPKKRRR